MDDDIQYRVKEFVAETARVRIGRLHSGTTLLCDLGIDGDDADDFFVEFRDHFDVDVSTLDLSKHFGPEGMLPWAPVVWLWNFFLKKGSPEEKANLTPIRISDLCETVRLGRWVPEANAMDENTKPTRRRFQFSMRTLFVVMTGVCVASMLFARIDVSHLNRWYNYPPLAWALAGPFTWAFAGNVMLAISIKLAQSDRSVVSAWCWFVIGWHCILADIAWYTITTFDILTLDNWEYMQESFDQLLLTDLWLPLFFSVLAADVFIRKRRVVGRRTAILIGSSLLIAGVNLIVLCVLFSNLLLALCRSWQ